MSDWVMRHKSDLLVEEEQAMFHNHRNNNGYHYRYPLIQYRSNKGKAAILVLGDAIPVVQKVLADMQPPFVMKGKQQELDWLSMDKKNHTLEMVEGSKPRTYRLWNWVALNNDRMTEWENLRGMSRRLDILEQALAGHLIAFAIGMDWRIEKRFEVDILELKDWRKIRYHKVHLNGFDVVFRVPLNLPSGIGLGKATSHGFGILRRGG